MSDQLNVPPLRLVQTFEPGDSADAPVADSPVVEADAVDLLLGSSGDRVARLQRDLKTWGFDPGESSGNYGDRTAEAVTALQRKLGLKTSGRFDAETAKAIEDDLASGAGSVLKRTMAIVPFTPPAAEPPKPSLISSLLSSPIAWILGGALLWKLMSSDSVSVVAGIDRVDIDDLDDLGESKPKRKRPKRSKKIKVEAKAERAPKAKRRRKAKLELTVESEPMPDKSAAEPPAAEPPAEPKPHVRRPRKPRLDPVKASDAIVDAEVIPQAPAVEAQPAVA